MQVHRLSSYQLNKNLWDSFIQQSSEGMLYAMHDFLSGTAGNWEAYVFEEGDEWQMVFPFKKSQKLILTYFLQPKFTQFLGPVFRKYPGKKARELQWKNKILQILCDRLKNDFWYVNFNLSPDFDYGLPFNWKKFRVSPRYTYRIELASQSLEELEKGILKGKVNIGKATNNGYAFNKTEKPHDLINAFSKIKGKDVGNLSTSDYKSYANFLGQFIAQNFCEVWELLSPNGELAGGMILYMYKGVMTYAFSMSDPLHSSNSVGHALIWKAITVAKDKGMRIFDFEGSMIPEIERVFRRFGAEPKSYLNIQYARIGFLYRS